jgi:hypothetical protein
MPALTLPTASDRPRVNVRFLEPIWHIKGSLPLPPQQSREEAFERLSPLFRVRNTSHHWTGDTLTFTKKDADAQDKMSIFDDGVLQVREGAAGAVLHYRLKSRALLYCFLAPLLFLAFAGLTIAVAKLDPPEAEAAGKKKDKAEKALPQNWIDKALGAPAPETPAEKAQKKKDAKEKDQKGPSPTPAYVFAGLFAALYVVGRVLEDRLIRRLFLKKLRGA